MLYKPGPYKNSVVRRADGPESRDLRAVCDNLEKELDRKDSRNDNLSRELFSLRASYANQQREQRIVTSTFEKLSTERANLSNHAIKSKEHIAKMEIKLARLGDSQLLLDHVDKQQQTLDSLQEHLNKSEGSLILKDDIIKSLEKELDTLHRAFDVQDRYEKPIMNSGNVGTNGIYVEREKMRSLYYELGKRQSNAHSLTLSLADSSIEISQLKQALKDAALLKLKMEESAVISGLQSQQELEEKKNLLNELSNVQENSRKANELHSKMVGQSEDLTKRLSELRCASDVIIAEKETLVFELSSLLYASQLEVVSLNGRIEELKQSVTLLQSSSDLTEQRSMTNLNKAIIERQVLTELLQEAELMKPELNMVHQHLEDAIRDREEKSRLIESARRLSEREILQARDTAEDLQRQLVAAQEHLEVIQKRECDLEEERTSALTTLQRTLEAAKALTVKLQCEKDRRILAEERANKAERLAETLQRAKEHVSSAVLDALHQEKAKSVRLEKVISQMTNSRDYIPHPVQRSSSVSPHRSTVTGRSDGEYNYDGHFSASIGGMSILPAQAATTSSSLKRHPLSAMQSIPPHNFLGRTVSSDLTAGAVIMEHRRSLPSFSQSSPSRMTACNLQNGQSKDLRRESWRLMERAVDSGVDTKRSRETLEDEISRASHAYDSLPVPEVRASTSKLPTSVSPPKSIVDGLTRLRDHLREIEEGVPSPLNQSKSFQSNYKPEFHRYSAHDGSVESSSSGEADLTPSEMNSPDSEDRGPVVRDIIIERTKYSESMSRSQTDRGDHGPPPLPSSVLNGSLAFASISNDKRLALGSRDIDIPTDVNHKHANLATFCSHLSDAYMNQDHFELSDEDISLFDLAK